MFGISKEALDRETLVRSMQGNPAVGALATFEGWVRNHHEGRIVVRLEYEAYEEMAQKEGARIIEDATERFDIQKARCVHRVGRLEIGEIAVWVGVTAAHRGDALHACEYIIEELKKRVPIWKKEFYVEGDGGWVDLSSDCGFRIVD